PPFGRPLALGLDTRNRDFSVEGFLELVRGLAVKPGLNAEILYLDCRQDVLVRRYSETRRRHPLAPKEPPTVGIERERDLLVPIRAQAEVIIDTSELTPHELAAEIRRFFDPSPEHRLAISVHSFSYKRGIPRGVDLVFDVRFLRNPHWEPELRELTGRDAPVQAHVSADPRHGAFLDRVGELVDFLLPAYREEGKVHLAIAFGCTGGRHRSVTLAEQLAKRLEKAGWQVSIRHRELERRAEAAPDSTG
ncbi:MAG: RNase adapter RapZ, partial [Alphaproteobacteria bacterium]